MLKKAVQPNRRPTERHLSLLKDGRGAKEEDNMSMPRLRHPAVDYQSGKAASDRKTEMKIDNT